MADQDTFSLDPGLSWPNAATIVVAAETARQHDWAADMVVGLVRELASSKAKVVLADLQGADSQLARKLALSPERGMVDVLFRGAPFSEVARRPDEESFYFLGTGKSTPPVRVLFEHPQWARVATRFAEARAHLLLCVSADDWTSLGPIEGFEPCVVVSAAAQVQPPAGSRSLAEFLAPFEIREDARPEEEPEASAAPDEPESFAAPDEPESFAAPDEPERAATPDELAWTTTPDGLGTPDVEESAASRAPNGDAPSPDAAFEETGAGDRAAESDVLEGELLDADPLEVELSGRDPDGIAQEAAEAPAPRRSTRSHVVKPRRRLDPRLPTAAAVAVVVLGLGFWWAMNSNFFSGGPVGVEAAADTTVSDASAQRPAPGPPTTASEETASPTPTAAGDGVTEDEPTSDEATSAASPGVALPYSVLIASFSSASDAMARREEWSRSDMTFYVAPTVVRGVVYHRVFAGLLADRDRAIEVMRQLVDAGVKDTVRNWDVRPARLAFDMGTFPRLEDAEKTIATLQGRGIPAYAVEVPDDGGERAYRVYSGGYEAPDDARPLEERITEAGFSANLVERVGMTTR